ncbi:hypothetical protein [Salinibacter ruber]|uniref:hypothetical protein n=1 Tax=Salinibacter ruber TaxID=146919 RepID=UPI00216769F2|nr:hypothetical protein [Salinibacter ruber]MCS4054104.1 hypothetical protein [Salinibacter ruber]
MRYTILLAATLLIPLAAHGQTEGYVISQDAPVLLHEYNTEITTENQGKVVEHRVSYVHQADTAVLGVEFGFIEYNLFRDLLDYSLVIETETTKNGKHEATFVNSPRGAFSFHEGVAYVSRVRLANGEVWEADTDDVLRQTRDSIGIAPETEIDSLRQRAQPVQSI